MKTKTVSQLKKECWVLFSKYIRLRDCLKTTGCASFGLCVTCSRKFDFKQLQAGHFISRQKTNTLFDDKNVHAQCAGCNNYGGATMILNYRRAIINMYGDKYDEEIEKRSRVLKKFTIPELLELKIELKKKIKGLE